MRRTIFLALLAALLLVVPTARAAGGTTKILRDCADDGILQGDYSAAQLRTARDHIPAELNEYSDCQDVLSRAIAAKTAASGGGGNPGGTTGGGTPAGGGTTGGGITPTTPSPANPEATKPTGRDPGTVMGPSTPQDWRAIDGANIHGADAIPVNGRRISPAAHVGRNGMPGTLVAVLALLAAAAVASTVPFIRRRVVSHRLA